MFSKEIKLIKESELFKPDLYLCSVFTFKNKTQFDFYSKKTKLVTSFVIEGNKVNLLSRDEKVFQKEQKDLEELDLSKVKIDIKKALEIVNNLIKEKYKGETATKKIIILQQDKEPFWNISSITTTFNLINIKINAINGNIIGEKSEPILSFKK